MAKKNKKKADIGTIIFRWIGIEIAAVILGFIVLAIIYLPGLIGKLQSSGMLSGLFGSRQTASVTVPANEEQPTAAPEGNRIEIESVTEPETKAPEEILSSVKLVAAGDNRMYRSSTLSGVQPDSSFNYSNNFCYMKDIFSAADIAVLSQDTVMAGGEYGLSNGDQFNTVLEVGQYMVEAGINVLLGANNHILDQGEAGLVNMISFWDSHYADMSLLGVNISQEEKDRPVYLTKNGIKIALVDVCSVSNVTADLETAPYLLNLWDEEWLDPVLKEAENNADFTIAFIQWGDENSQQISEDQYVKTQFLSDRGVDLIIGTYPGVVQPAFWITGAQGNKTLIYASLGNFQSIQDKMVNMLGALANVTITKTTYKTYISDCDMGFVVSHYGHEKTNDYYDIVTTFPWEDYSAELAAQHGIIEWDAGFSYEALEKLIGQIRAACQW